VRNEQYSQLGLYLSATIFALVVSLSMVTFLLFAVSPRDIGSVGVTVWFIALFVLLASLVTLTRFAFKRRHHPELQERIVLFRKSVRLGLVIGLFGTIALGMQSLRMLSVTDILLFLMTVGIIELYFRTKRR